MFRSPAASRLAPHDAAQLFDAAALHGVLHRVAAQGGVVRHHDIVANDGVVADMGARHEQVVGADARHAAASAAPVVSMVAPGRKAAR